MKFSDESINKLEEAYSQVEREIYEVSKKFIDRVYSSARAKEYAHQGYGRRLSILKRCIENIYSKSPASCSKKLSFDNVQDIDINLQCFVLNVYGCLDNLAWIWVEEKKILNKNGRRLEDKEIGFFKKPIKKSFSAEFQSYLETLTDWFSYLESFRHSLAHRIPLYVPPAILTDEEVEKYEDLERQKINAIKSMDFDKYDFLNDQVNNLGQRSPYMTHSFEENSPQTIFHAQIIYDLGALLVISERFLDELDK